MGSGSTHCAVNSVEDAVFSLVADSRCGWSPPTTDIPCLNVVNALPAGLSDPPRLRYVSLRPTMRLVCKSPRAPVGSARVQLHYDRIILRSVSDHSHPRPPNFWIWRVQIRISHISFEIISSSCPPTPPLLDDLLYRTRPFLRATGRSRRRSLPSTVGFQIPTTVVPSRS